MSAADRSNPSPSGTTIRANVFAAGAILWRDTPSGVRIAVVHRPKYDDWSLPKGKLDPGETSVVAAVREIAEETGVSARLGRYLGKVSYPITGHRRIKRVDYWSASVVSGEFAENDEVDTLLWLTPDETFARISYPMDQSILRRFLTIDATRTTTFVLVRHAKAGSRKRYSGDDRFRPLDAAGLRQAQALVPQLAAFGVTEVHAADRVRCVETVAPYASEIGRSVVLEPLLSEEAFASDPEASRARILELAAGDTVRGVCSQGKVIPPLLEWWAERDGVTLPKARNRKAGMWVLTLLDGRLAAADYLASPLPVEPAAELELPASRP